MLMGTKLSKVLEMFPGNRIFSGKSKSEQHWFDFDFQQNVANRPYLQPFAYRWPDYILNGASTFRPPRLVEQRPLWPQAIDQQAKKLGDCGEPSSVLYRCKQR